MKVYRNSAEILADRAMEPEPEQDELRMRRTAATVPDFRVAPRSDNRGRVYDGTAVRPRAAAHEPPAPPRTAAEPKAKKQVRQKSSTLRLLVFLVLGTAGILIYVNNVIEVERMTVEIASLKAKRDKLLLEQELLKAQTNRLTASERIRTIAKEQLGLEDPPEMPGTVGVDSERAAREQRIN